MKTGANRKTIGSDVYLLSEPRPEPLGKVGRTDFAAFPGAEKEILDTFVRYRSHLRAEQNAPDLRLLQKKITGLSRTIQDCRDQIADFLRTGEDSWTSLEFRAAICDLLLDSELDRVELDVAMEDTIDNLVRIGLFLSAASAALEKRVSKGEIAEVSSREAREDYYRRLHRTLVKHRLDKGVGENSLIVLLVCHIDGNWNHATVSGEEASREAAKDRRRRKDLAAAIKSAVNAREGGTRCGEAPGKCD